MSIEIKVPTFPESISEGEIASWNKQKGDAFSAGETLVEIETDKVVMEVPAMSDGVMGEQLKQVGDTVLSNEVIGAYAEGALSAAPAKEAPKAVDEKSVLGETKTSTDSPEVQQDAAGDSESPAVRRMLKEHGLKAADITGSGKDGRIVKEDIEKHLSADKSSSSVADVKVPASESVAMVAPGERIEKRVPMTRLRATIAKRLVEVGQITAMLTTFNEVDMHAVKNLRATYKDKFEKDHGVRLGFMSFFLKAATEALKRFPAVNASIDGKDVIYHGYFDIGVAVSSPRGLVVPVVRNVDTLGLADIESQIKGYAVKARDGKLTLDEMQGGTFTVTNGGVFGSMLSTPIINPPQSAILGMHNIVDRPMVVDGEIKIRPIMYLALSYDHRIVDGQESVSFLRTIKELLEDPARMILNV